jgi:hypothetical protein
MEKEQNKQKIITLYLKDEEGNFIPMVHEIIMAEKHGIQRAALRRRRSAYKKYDNWLNIVGGTYYLGGILDKKAQ